MDEMELDPFALERNGASPEAVAHLAEVAQDVFVLALKALLTIAIDGYPRAIRSTNARRNELLRGHNGDARAAAESAADTQEGFLEEAREYLLRLIPYMGMPASVLYPLWKHLRVLCIIASAFGHDLHSETLHARVVYAIAGLRGAPKLQDTLEKATEALWRKMAGSLAKRIPVAEIVANAVDLESQAMTLMIDLFSDGPGVAEAEYVLELDPEPQFADFMKLLHETGQQTLEKIAETLKDPGRKPHWEDESGRLRADL